MTDQSAATPAAAQMAGLRADFIERVGLSMQSDGLPRIAGRVLGRLIWDGTAISFSDLATGLGVSRGSISTATRFLEERGLIRRTARPGERQDYFELAPAPYHGMMQAISAKMRRAKDDIDVTLKALPAAETEVRGRIGCYRALFDCMEQAVGAALKRLG